MGALGADEEIIRAGSCVLRVFVVQYYIALQISKKDRVLLEFCSTPGWASRPHPQGFPHVNWNLSSIHRCAKIHHVPSLSGRRWRRMRARRMGTDRHVVRTLKMQDKRHSGLMRMEVWGTWQREGGKRGEPSRETL